MPTQEDIENDIALLERELYLRKHNQIALFQTIVNPRDIDRYLVATENLQHRIDEKRREVSA